MKKLLGAILGILVLISSGVGAKGQSLSQADLDRGLQYLETTKKNIVDATRGLSEAQWNFKPSPFKWSVAQVIEHIAPSEDLLRQVAESQIKTAPAVPDRDLKKADDAVLTLVPDRSRKFQAPEMLAPPVTRRTIAMMITFALLLLGGNFVLISQAPEVLRPKNQFGSPEGALKHFLESRTKTVELLKTTPDLRAHVVDGGPLGKLDAYDRILFVAAHSERHTKQLLEVKADPKFPKQ